MSEPGSKSAPPASGTSVVTISVSGFFLTFLAVSKILEVVFCFLAFICTLIANGESPWWRYDMSSSSFVAAITIIGAIAGAVIFILAVLGVWFTKIPLKVRLIIETIYCGLWLIFMLTCTLLSAQAAFPSHYYYDKSGALVATAVFSAFALIVFSMDLLVAIQKLLILSGRSIEQLFGIALATPTTTPYAEPAKTGQVQFTEEGRY